MRTAAADVLLVQPVQGNREHEQPSLFWIPLSRSAPHVMLVVEEHRRWAWKRYSASVSRR